MVDMSVLDELCHTVTDKAFQTAAPRASIVQIYVRLNIGVAGLIDDLRETFAEHVPGDAEFRIEAERFVIETCSRRASELVASSVQGVAL